jgi:hypothetical protein
MTHTNNQTSPVAKWIVLWAVAFSTVAMTGCEDYDDLGDNRSYTISGDASGSQMTPSVAASGTGTISGTYDSNTKVLTYTSNWSGLSGPPIAGGFYDGASGAVGVAVGAPWPFDPGMSATGSLSGTMTLTTSQANQLTSGNWYYSYGTAANTTGEIRGQISAEERSTEN